MAFFKVHLAVVVLLAVILAAQAAPVELVLKPVVRGDDKWCEGLPHAVSDGDDCKKHQDERRKRQEEELKRQEEERKRITEERKKTAEEGAKAIEEAVKNIQDGKDGKAGLPTGPVSEMSDAELYLTAALGDGVGECKIELYPEGVKQCFQYVKCRVPDVHENYGFPKQTLPDGSKSGTGCVDQKDGPKGHDGMCRYEMASYAIEDSWTICTDFGFFNAVNMLKMALKKGQC